MDLGFRHNFFVENNQLRAKIPFYVVDIISIIIILTSLVLCVLYFLGNGDTITTKDLTDGNFGGNGIQFNDEATIKGVGKVDAVGTQIGDIVVADQVSTPLDFIELDTEKVLFTDNGVFHDGTTSGIYIVSGSAKQRTASSYEKGIAIGPSDGPIVFGITDDTNAVVDYEGIFDVPNVAVNSSAVLSLTDSSGIVIPEVADDATRALISTPYEAQIIYHVADDTLQYYDGANWQSMGSTVFTGGTITADLIGNGNNIPSVGDLNIPGSGTKGSGTLGEMDVGGLLDLSGMDRMVLPRMTDAEVASNIPTPALADLIYNDTRQRAEFYDNTSWVSLLSVFSGGTITGDITMPTNDIVGTQLLTGNTITADNLVLDSLSVSGTPNSSAAIDYSDVNSSGLLLPQLTAAERDAIVTPSDGLLVFVDGSYQYYDNTAWRALGGSSTFTGGTVGADVNMLSNIFTNVDAVSSAASTHASAIMDFSAATSAGTLLPNVTQVVRDTLTSPEGSLIMNTDLGAVQVRTGDVSDPWKSMVPNACDANGNLRMGGSTVVTGSGNTTMGCGAGPDVMTCSYSVALGKDAGPDMGDYSVSIGVESFKNGAGATKAVSVGNECGATDFSVMMGHMCGMNATGIGITAKGWNAVENCTGDYVTALGIEACKNAMARCTGIGYQCCMNAALEVTGVGYQAAMSSGNYACACGFQAGMNNQGEYAVALGKCAGKDNQGIGALALAHNAARTDQGDYAVAGGELAGDLNQGMYAVAWGLSAGRVSQGIHAVAFGNYAGEFNQGAYAIAYGHMAGNLNQGEYAIAIGPFAGETNQHARTIVINATGAALNTTATDQFIMAPIRQADFTYTLVYDHTLKKIMRDNDGSKTFVIDHPTKKDKLLVHSCLEGPEGGVFYRGEIEIGEDGTLLVHLDDYVPKFAYNFTVNVNGLNYPASADHVTDGSFTIYGHPGDTIHWIVHATREEIEVEPLRKDYNMMGVGSYKYLIPIGEYRHNRLIPVGTQ